MGLIPFYRQNISHFHGPNDSACRDLDPVEAVRCMAFQTTLCVCVCVCVSILPVSVSIKWHTDMKHLTDLQVQGNECQWSSLISQAISHRQVGQLYYHRGLLYGQLKVE